MKRYIRIPKPTYTREFLLIVADGLSPSGRNDIPKRYVDMAGGQTDGRRACDHQRGGDGVCRRKPELLAEFARNCFTRVLAWLDVASCRKPELRTPVIYEKDFASVNYGKVRNQVFRRSGWLCGTKKGCTGIDPGQCMRAVVLFLLIIWANRSNFAAYCCARHDWALAMSLSDALSR